MATLPPTTHQPPTTRQPPTATHQEGIFAWATPALTAHSIKGMTPHATMQRAAQSKHPRQPLVLATRILAAGSGQPTKPSVKIMVAASTLGAERADDAGGGCWGGVMVLGSQYRHTGDKQWLWQHVRCPTSDQTSRRSMGQEIQIIHCDRCVGTDAAWNWQD